MTDKLHNEIKSQPERIALAHGKDETPDVVGHAFAIDEKSRVAARGEVAAGEDGEGRICV